MKNTSFHLCYGVLPGMNVNKEYPGGFLIGFSVVFVMILLILFAVRNRNSKTCEFDERQLLIRGKAFKIGFFTLVIYNFIYGITNIVLEKTCIDQSMAFFLGIIVALCVFTVYCIWNDAYVAINRNPVQFMLLFAVLGGINLLSGVLEILKGEVYHDGMLDFRSTSLFVGMLFVILFITYALKNVFKNEGE